MDKTFARVIIVLAFLVVGVALYRDRFDRPSPNTGVAATPAGPTTAPNPPTPPPTASSNTTPQNNTTLSAGLQAMASASPQVGGTGSKTPITVPMVQAWCSGPCSGRLIPLEQVSQPGDVGVKLQTGHPVTIAIPGGVSADTYYCEGNNGPPHVSGPATIQGVCEASLRGAA